MSNAEPKIYPKNSPQVRGVSNGEIQVGWVNHYYLHKLKAANPELSAANYSFTDDKDAGNLMMLSGVGVPLQRTRPTLRSLSPFSLKKSSRLISRTKFMSIRFEPMSL